LDILIESRFITSKLVAFSVEQNHSLALANGPIIFWPRVLSLSYWALG